MHRVTSLRASLFRMPDAKISACNGAITRIRTSRRRPISRRASSMTGFALRETRGTSSSPISYACSATPCRHGERAAVRDGYRLRVHRTPPHTHPGREVPPDPVLRVLLQPDAFAPAPPEDVLGAGVLVPPLGEQADVGLRLYAPALRMRG